MDAVFLFEALQVKAISANRSSKQEHLMSIMNKS